MLTDSQGRRVNFSNAVVIMTSNVGAADILTPKRLGFAAVSAGAEYEQMKESVRGALRETFRPEFLNRIDEIITFGRLREEDIRQIAALMLAGITKRTAALGASVRFDESVVANLAREGLDPHYGARPLRRVIVRRVEDVLSDEMLAGRIQAGDSVTAVWDDGVKFEKKQE